MRTRRIVKIAAIVAIVLVAVAGGLFALGYERDLSLAELSPRWATGASRFVDVGGTQVHYRDEGQGPETIVLLHGTAASLHTWDAWVAALAPRYRVVRLDLPGFGLTGPDGSHDYSIVHYVDFVTRFLAAVGVERFLLVGSSLGGHIAWKLALALPERVQSLVLVDAGGFPRGDPPLVFTLARTPGTASIVRWVTPRSLIRKSLLEVYGDDAKVSDALVDRYFQLARRAGNREAFVERARTPFVDETAALASLHVPTLVLWGAVDAWIPVAHAEMFRKAIPGAQLVVYPGVGHVPMEELPERTVADVQAFLGKLPAAAR